MSREVLAIDPNLIDLTDRLRDLDGTQMSRLLVSFQAVGQITPIEVWTKPDGRYKLISGRHRVQAAIELGYETIDAIVFAGSADEAALREIDENLARVELSAYDQANFMERRRQIWEKLHGEIKRGGDRRSKSQAATLEQSIKKTGFFKATAATLGIDPQTVKRALSRKAHILPALWEELKGTKDSKNGALLDKLRKESLEDQAEVLRLTKEGGTTIGYSLSVLRERVRDKPDTVVDMVRKVTALWAGWTPQERQIFRKEIGKLK